MLVLSRKEGELVHVGDGITVRVLKVRGGRVWIGIEAPPDVPILRGELHSVRQMLREECGPEPLPAVIAWGDDDLEMDE
jgi:carbon storage regulator